MAPKILFLTLRTFSMTGGIEKVCRVMCRTLFDMGFELAGVKVYSMYDKNTDRDSKYIDKKSFTAFDKQRIRFVISSFIASFKTDIVILSHVNLLFTAVLIKIFDPKKRIIVYAHGIEVWRNLRNWKKYFLKSHCEIWAVSEFTADRMIESDYALPQNIRIVPNCLDPFLEVPAKFNKPELLSKKYGINGNQKVLLTLTRLSSYELYKGYDIILNALPLLLKDHPEIHYILAGNADSKEQLRLVKLVEDLGISEQVTFAGFIAEEELSDHFLLSDLFIMPSQKEGFGIVFIEAAACGCRIIGGNQDGSPQALLNGKLGILVHPEDLESILKTISNSLSSHKTFKESKSIQDLCLDNFSYPQYLERVRSLL